MIKFLIKGVDLDRLNLLKQVNESLNDGPFNFYICRSELSVEWHDLKGCPWNDPIYASVGSHDWEERSRSTSITSWHNLTGSRCFKHLDVNLGMFSAVLNPNSSARRFWERPDQCDDAWGDPDESEHEIISEDTLSRTVFYHRWFLALWPRELEFDMLLKHEYKQALDFIIDEMSNTEESADCINKGNEARLRRVLARLKDTNCQIDAVYVKPVLKLLADFGNLELILEFFQQSHAVLSQKTFDVELIIKLIVQCGFSSLKDGLNTFLKTSEDFLAIHIKISEVYKL